MSDEFYKDADERDKEFEELKLRERALILSMTQTDGWEIIKKRVNEIKAEHLDDLLTLPVTIDKLSHIALAQSKVNACKMLFDIVESYLI